MQLRVAMKLQSVRGAGLRTASEEVVSSCGAREKSSD